MSQLIIPGDNLTISDSKELVIGPGIHVTPITKEIIPVHSGILQQANNALHIESNSRRYIPSNNDYVIGLVTGVFGDNFRVSLSNFSFPVSLSAMAFPNATKKNRPNLKIGNLIYARVSNASPEVDVEIECIDPTTGKDGGFGLLEGGYVFDVSLSFARSLLFDVNHTLLNLLVKKCKFELAIGLNGKIWIKADDLKYTLALAKSIEKAQLVYSGEFNKVINSAFSELGL
ncbi:hypothetical protein WICANDRAFT_35899 [Wickerhamomyces anomalus NRRL Y-366-8]|uniref:Ribosomal RNA-processing protein 40 n=1 Tax=Wickerhamomyces anomalus (strain ATCC 58044 / CBS 1984 / NCYC 433 / NRRL Y-366-8) TaxID=683960 RepID=A0A1E3NVN2_WICAA|nr:uncharacterized protein WICANDRAFT_35899 [Wickerhamomyces anomalus NRRL Y-366-8]ODQ57173.1 hypothetical protein WICANDRAFT_35899 [Wickerhamomyces anomalus NRRL Y-366-8]